MILLLLLGSLFIPLAVLGKSSPRRIMNLTDIEIISRNLIDRKAEDEIHSGQTHIWVKTLDLNMQDDLHRIRAQLPRISDFDKNMFSFITFSASNGRDSVVFHLPERTSNGTIIYEASRFLHPLFDTYKKKDKGVQFLIITIHTLLKESFKYEIGVQGLSESQYVVRTLDGSFLLENQKVGIGKPEANFWDTSNIEFAQISIRSRDDLCAVLFLNNREESIYYNTGVINSNPNEGFRAISFSSRLDLNLGRNDLKNQLFLIVILQPDESLCNPSSSSRRNFNELKTYTLSITTQSYGSYIPPLSFFIGIFLATPIVLTIYIIAQIPKRVSQPIENTQTLLISFDSVQEVNEPLGDCIEMAELETFREVSLEERTGSNSTLSNKIKASDQGGYNWSMGDLHFAFYMVPGLLLSGSQYAQSLTQSRLEDICYQNYGCARPLGTLVAFNHVMSNVGYLLNGCYYILFVIIRHKHHNRVRGPFKNNGLELSLGTALICQGIASAIFHVCPSPISFSFDTPFMQVICVLAILKLRGNRHGVVTPARANAFIAGVFGYSVAFSICDQTFFFRLLQGVTQMIIASFLLLKISRPTQSNRLQTIKAFGFTGVALILNLLFAILHILNIGPVQSNLVLILCIANMLLYIIYYYISKILAHERLNWLSVMATSASLILWIAAGVFFLKEETNWKLTPAQSRNLNSNCLLFDFFDRHDIWHLLSSQGALASLIALSTIDDAQASFPRDELAIF